MLLPSMFIFPDPIEVDPEGQGLICIGADLESSTLYEAYTHGLFPWFNEGDPICWWCPEPRCIIHPDTFKPSKSLLRNMKKFDYKITINQAFEQVMRACAKPRDYTSETWISEDFVAGYTELFRNHFGYSIEVWEGAELVGGLYGVSIGQGLFGESMFSLRTDVSKMAFYTLMLLAKENKIAWVDCQLVNDHLLRLGATTISRETYLNSLQNVISAPSIDWQTYKKLVLSSRDIAQYADMNHASLSAF